MTSRAVFSFAAIGLAAYLSPVAHGAITLGNGQSVPLTSILNSTDHQVDIGDKVFTFNSYNSAAFPASVVFITGFISANPNDGIGFDITGGFGDVVPGDALVSEFNLLYTVDIVPANLNLGYRLKDVGLVFNGSAFGAGSYARVDETILNASGVPGQNLLATLSTAIVAGGATTQQDYRNFLPQTYTSFQVNKDVQFFAHGAGDSASASFVRQTFSQTIVPAPGSAALLGMAGLVAIRRRRA